MSYPSDTRVGIDGPLILKENLTYDIVKYFRQDKFNLQNEAGCYLIKVFNDQD